MNRKIIKVYYITKLPYTHTHEMGNIAYAFFSEMLHNQLLLVQPLKPYPATISQTKYST